MTPALYQLLNRPNPIADFDFANGVYRLGGLTTGDFSALPGFSSVNSLNIAPTVGITTGATDVISVAGVTFPTAITIVTYATPTSTPATSTGPVTVNDGTVTNRLTIYRQSSNSINAFASTSVTNDTLVSGATATANIQFRGVATVDGATVRFSANGLATVVGAAPAAAVNPTILTTINVGHNAGAGQFLGTTQRILIVAGTYAPGQMQQAGALPA